MAVESALEFVLALLAFALIVLCLFADVEVDELDVFIFSDDNVLGLDISVGNSFAVKFVDSRNQFGHN